MRVLLIGDPHLDSQTPLARMDNFKETTINKLSSILLVAKKQKVDKVILSGDVFDKYDQSISYLNSVAGKLREFIKDNIEVMSVIGNHDLPYNSMQYFSTTPLSLLFKSGLITPIDKEEFDDIVIHGINFTEADKLDTIEVVKNKRNLLVMHYAVDNTVPGDSLKSADLTKFDIVLSGHDHMFYPLKFVKETAICRPGSMTRRTKEEHNLTRDIIMYLYDSKDHEVTEVILPDVKPAEEIFKNEAFTASAFDPNNDKYASIFNKDYFDNDTGTNLYAIIDELPPAVYDNSKVYLRKQLKELGVEKED